MIVCRLKDVLEQRGWSRRRLAELAAVNVNTICKWSHGNLHTVNLEALGAICSALQCQPADLLVHTQSAPPKPSPPPEETPRLPFHNRSPLPP